MRRVLPALAAACFPLLAGCALLGAGQKDDPGPTISPPSGMRNQTWGDYAFAIPSAWTLDVGDTTAWRDANGAVQMEVSGGSISQCPKPGNSEGWGNKGSYDKDTGQTVTSVRPFHVPGSGGALRYTLTGGQPGEQIVLQTWLPDCKDSLVLLIDDTGVADRIADTLVAKAGRP